MTAWTDRFDTQKATVTADRFMERSGSKVSTWVTWLGSVIPALILALDPTTFAALGVPPWVIVLWPSVVAWVRNLVAQRKDDTVTAAKLNAAGVVVLPAEPKGAA